MGEKIVYELMSPEEIEANKGKYLLNGKTLHIIGACRYTKSVYKHSKIFSTLDEAIASETRYMSHCKICFKEKK